MARVHTEADIRAVGQHLIDTLGESALTRTNVQAGLKARAVERGLEPTAADHRAVSEVIAAMKAELRAARETAQAAAVPGAEDSQLPVGLDAALARHAQEVERICRQSLAEATRQSEIGARARIKQVESEHAGQLDALRSDLEVLQHDAATQAGQLDETEADLAIARASLASVSAALEEKIAALQSLDRDMQLQLSAARDTLYEVWSERTASDERAHASQLAHTKTSSELAVALERIQRIEAELGDAREAAEHDAAKVREAERTRDVAQGRLTALEEECAWLRPRLERVSNEHRSNEKVVLPTGLSKKKAKNAGGP